MRARFAEEPRQVDLGLLAGGREADQDDRAAERDQRQRQLERRATADDVEGEVDRPGAECVAPKRRACSSLRSSRSIARISEAPAIRAPWITERPTAPQPITATRAPSQTLPSRAPT